VPWTEPRPDGSYRAGWRDAAGRQRRKSGFRREADARRYAGEQESRARRGEVVLSGRSITWGEWCDHWLTLRQVEPSTSSSDAARLRAHVRPRWDGVRLNRITREDVQAWANDLSRAGLAPATVVRVFHLLSASLVDAVKYGRLAVSPAEHVDLPAATPGHERYLTRAELDVILEHLNEPYRSMAALLAGTGLRFGELAGLHWQRVDLGERLLSVVEVYDSTEREIKPYPKSGSRKVRSVPLASWVAEILDALPRTPGPCGVPHRSGVACRSGLVLPAPRGRALDERNVRPRHWVPAVRAAGVGPTRLHDLRHTCASWLVQSGRTLQEVAEILGHESITTTMRYAHLSSARYDLARAALDEYGPGREKAPVVEVTTGANVIPLRRVR
jgi:integrase